MRIKDITSVGVGLLAFASHAGAQTAGCEKYTYDAAGNIVKKHIGEQITRFGYDGNTMRNNSHGITYMQDDTGRLLGESRNGRIERKLSYQFGDKVTEIENEGTETGLFYNAEGQLVGRSASDEVEVFAWDGLGLALRGNMLLANEDHVVGGMAALIDGEVTVSDMNGTTLSVGERKYQSTAFGEALEDGLFTGKPFVEELRGFVFKHRVYSASEARWSTADPVGFPDGLNNYEYVNSDPVMNVDPFGLWTWKKETPLPSGPNPKGSATPSTDPSDRRTIFGVYGEYSFSKQWVFDEWHETNHEDQGGLNEALSGTFSVTEASTQTVQVGVEIALLEDLKVKGSSSTTQGGSVTISKDYNRAAQQNQAWRVVLGQSKGTITEYQQKFKSVGGGRNRSWVPDGSPSATSNIENNIIIPTSVANIWYREN